MKSKILKLFLLILFCIPLCKILGNIDIKAETGSETLSVEFGVESKTTVELGTDTNYDGWNSDEIAALYISIGNLDTSKVYKLIITMDPIIYAPVETLPYPSGASTSFTKNEDLHINGSETYELMKYSGTIVYTFNNDKDKTIEIDNFKLQLKYDQILWHKFANQAINIGDGPLLKVELVEGDSNTLSTKYLNEATSNVKLQDSMYYGLKLNGSSDSVYMPNGIIGRIDNTIDLTINVSSASTFVGQYYNKLTIVIDVPKVIVDGNYYYLQYNLNNFDFKCQFNKVVDKSYYNITAAEDKIILEIEDYYFKNKGILTGQFTYPQDDVFVNNPGEYQFKGNLKTYVNGNESLTLKNSSFLAKLNTQSSAIFEQFLLDNGSVYGDIKNRDHVQKLGGMGLQNSGEMSGRIKLSYLFDNNLSDDYTILVTTMQLMPDYVSKNLEIKYSLMDENNNIVWFDSSGNIVPEGTSGASQYWTVSIKNGYYNSKKPSYSHRILFNRDQLPIESHKDYYFRSIEYIHGGFKTNEKHHNSSSTSAYDSAPGTFWGYVKSSKINKYIKTEIKVYQENLNGEFVEETDLSTVVQTRTTNKYDSSMGLTNPEISNTSISAGESFSFKADAFVIDYPYARCNVINTEDSNLVFAFKLPVGVTINASGTTFTNEDGTKTIPIVNLTSTAIDSEYNLWIVELEGGHEIGYATESLSKLPNGDRIKMDVAFNTALTTASSTIFFQTSVFFTAAGYSNVVSGSKKNYRILDDYDINNNGSTTDYLGAFNSQEYNTLAIQIKDKIAQLDISDSVSVNSSGIDINDGIIEDYLDVITYDFKINCISGGKAEDFAYYIPIVKENSIVDNELIFSAEYSYKLLEKVTVSNLITSNGVKVLYGFDSNVTYTLATSSSFVWYETIPDDKSLSDVTIIKVVSQEAAIENGSNSVVTIKMAYDGEFEDYIEVAGMKNSWTSKGQYKFKIGDRTTLGLYSTQTNNLSINYTFDQQVIELTTSPGNHTDDIGNDSKVIEILTTFKNVQTFKISNITTYNAIITDVLNMETNAHLLTGDEANRTFAFYTTLDSNTKQDIAQINPILGTVSSLSTFKLNFEIFNADVISDITTIRYIDITIESENGVTIPVRINIKRELTVIGTVSNSISSGKQYTLFGTTETQITISKDSAFTAQFSAENIIPNNYKGRKLVFTNTLPVNSTIVLIDLTNTNNVKYYMYEITSSDTNTIDLTKFNVMGKETKYIVTTGLEAITEKLLFIIDLPDDNTLLDGTLNSINLARTLNSNIDEMSPEGLKFTTKDIREYELKATNNLKLGEEIIVEYEISEIDYSDSKYNDRKLSLSIIPTSTNSIYDSSIEYNGNTYYLNSNNEFIIPLSDVQTSGKYSIKFIYKSPTIKYNEGTCDLNIKLIASATSSAEKPHLGQTLKEVNINLTTSKKSSLKVESMSDRVIKNDELKDTVEVKYNALNVTGKVTLELQEKIGEGYTTDSTLLEAVNGSTTQISGKFTVTGVYTLKLKFSQLMPSGNYQILFTVYDSLGNVERTVTYKFVVVNE